MASQLRRPETDSITRTIIPVRIEVHVSQVLSYLRFADLDVGLLLNFNVDALAAGGWKRILRAR